MANEIAPHLAHGAVVVNKSTVPVGSARCWSSRLLDRPDVAVVSNPEFLREGTAVHDACTPTGSWSAPTTRRRRPGWAALFAVTQAPLIVTDAATAETIKYASNAFLATKLSFVNAVANLCEAVGADVRDVLLGHGLRPPDRLRLPAARARAGVGRACPRTPGPCSTSAEQAGYDFALLAGAIETNEAAAGRGDGQGPATPWAGRSTGDGGGVGTHLQGPHRRPP